MSPLNLIPQTEESTMTMHVQDESHGYGHVQGTLHDNEQSEVKHFSEVNHSNDIADSEIHKLAHEMNLNDLDH